MTSDEVKSMCREMGVMFDENHPDHITTDKLQNITPPFMEYILTDHPIYADGERYIEIKDLTIRLYSDTEVSEAEKAVKSVLEYRDIRWQRSTEYIEELLLFAIIYKMEV